MVKIIIGFSFSLLINFCWGQSFTTINYSVPEGLPSTEVYEVYQDKRGFLWFATDNGVAKFDGYEMQTFHTEQGLSDPVVFGFHEDRKGRIWFRTYSGKLSYYDHSQGKIFKYRFNDKVTSMCNNSYPWVIHVDSLEQLWFSVNSGWGKIDSVGNLQKQEITGGYYFKKIENKYLYGNSKKYAGLKINIDNTLVDFKSWSSGAGFPYQSAITWKGRLYLSVSNDLFEYDSQKLRRVLSGNGGIISLSIDREDNLWVGCLKGAQRYSSPDFFNPWSPAFLDDVSVTEVIQDHERGLWFTTLEKGVFYIPNFNVKNHLLYNDKNVFGVSLLNNNILVSFRQGDLLTIDKNNYSIRQKKKFQPNINSHFVDSRNNIWLASYRTIKVIDSSFRLKKNMNRILPLWEDNQGILWGVGKDRLSVQTCNLNFELLASKNLNLLIRNILTDDTLVFISGRTGLHVYNKNLDLLQDLRMFADYKISKLISLNDTTLLLSTIGDGFFLLNKKTWKHLQYNKKRSFIANNIYTALKTDSSLWLASEHGIIKTNINSLLNQTPSFQVLTQKSGLISDKINFLLDVDANLLAFSDHGFSVFPKNVSQFSNDLPVFYIKDFSVDGQNLDIKRDIELSNKSNNFSISFGFIAFNNQNIFSRYRIKKAASWDYTPGRDLKFNSLSPGEYNLEIEYSMDNIHWNPAFTSSLIIILPPLWQTWYFQTIVGLTVLLIIFLYFVNQVRIYKQHQRKLIQAELEAIEEERSRIAKDLHDSVGTDFTAIKMIVSQLLTKHSEPKTGEIEIQFQSTIQDIKNIIYGLSPPGLERYGLFSGLKNYVDKLNGTIPIKIEINTFGVEIKDPKLSMTVFRILQELISNSLKHSKAEKIAVHINSFEDLLNIVYEDNGKGFSFEENHKGLGLYNIESRIQSLNGKIKFDSGAFGISYNIDVPLIQDSKA